MSEMPQRYGQLRLVLPDLYGKLSRTEFVNAGGLKIN